VGAFLPIAGHAICPLPIAWLARERAAGALLAASAAAAVVAALLGLQEGVSYLLQFGVGGALLGAGVSRGWKPEAVVGGFALVVGSSLAALLIGAAMLQGTSPVELVGTMLDQATVEIRKAAEVSTSDKEELAQLDEWARMTTDFLRMAFYGVIAVYGLFIGWLNALMLRRMVRAKNEPTPAWILWKAPEWLIWAFIGGGLLTVAGRQPWMAVGINVLLVTGTMYLFQGLAVIQYLFEVKRVPAFVRIAVYGLMVFAPHLLLAAAALGAFDMWLDVRSRISPPTEAAE
jgi:uncharacterized protein YybS (DUF2232 family)